MTSSNEQEAERWKSKYLHGLDEIEAKEKEWAELEAQLQKAMGRLALAGYGTHPSLDRKLDKLRNAIKRERSSDDLCDIVTDVSDTASRLKDPTASPFSTPSRAVSALLEAILFPDTLIKEKDKLVEKLSAKDAEKDLEGLINNVSELIGKASSLSTTTPAVTAEPAAESREKKSGSGLLSGLFGKNKERKVSPDRKEPANTTAGDNSSRQQERELLNNIFSQCSVEDSRSQQLIDTLQEQVSSQTDIDLLVKDIASLLSDAFKQLTPTSETESLSGIDNNEALLQLLEKLSFPPSFEARLQAIKTTLETPVSTDRLIAVLDDIANIIDDVQKMLEREKHEIELFLKSVTERIQFIDSSLNEGEASRLEGLEAGKQFRSDVRREMNDMRTSVADAEDFEQLKGSIVNSLDAVEERIVNFQKNEEQRQEAEELRISELNRRIGDLQIQTGRLQQSLKKSRHEASKDMLTGLGNRRALDQRIEQEYNRWKRYGKPLSLVMLDIDHFKKINDTYGHQAGDKALKTLASRLEENVRETDYVARYGGEEFAIIMPETLAEAAFIVADKLRETVASCEFHYRDTPVKITISCGIAQFHHNDETDHVFKRADDALYAAKQGGRNQCQQESLEDHAVPPPAT